MGSLLDLLVSRDTSRIGMYVIDQGCGSPTLALAWLAGLVKAQIARSHSRGFSVSLGLGLRMCTSGQFPVMLVHGPHSANRCLNELDSFSCTSLKK